MITPSGIEVCFNCSVCGQDHYVETNEFAALKLLPPPAGWVWVMDRGYCDKCFRYAGVSVGPALEKKEG